MDSIHPSSSTVEEPVERCARLRLEGCVIRSNFTAHHRWQGAGILPTAPLVTALHHRSFRNEKWKQLIIGAVCIIETAVCIIITALQGVNKSMRHSHHCHSFQ